MPPSLCATQMIKAEVPFRSDARSKLACAFLAAAVVALLVLRRVTRTVSLFGRGALALHRREAPFAPRGFKSYLPAAQLPTQGTTEMRGDSRF